MYSITHKELSAAERIDWLRLIRTENVGPITFRQLLGRYGSVGAALEALPQLAKRGGGRSPFVVYSKGKAEAELEALEKAGSCALAYCEPDYPIRLASVDDGPPLLFVKGNTHLLRLPAVAVVGARNASANGRRFAQKLAEDLGGQGILVVSGLARGIDTAAHRGSIPNGTAAVLAGGLDIVYPPENEALQQEIAQSGILLSEMPLGTKPQARHFPRRNRIISGLCLALVVVEAAPRSGSLITARLAADQGREVLAVPGSPLDPRSEGCNNLIREGATLIRSAKDIMEAINPLVSRPLEEPPGLLFEQEPQGEPDEGELSEARRAVLSLLGPSAVSVDELVRECQFSAPVVALVILELELAGQIERQAGGRVALRLGDVT